jgi:RNA polymerase-binding transcription factor DksA
MPKAKQQAAVQAKGVPAAEAAGGDAPGRKRAGTGGPAKTELAPLKASATSSARKSNGVVAKAPNGAAQKVAAGAAPAKQTSAKAPTAKAPVTKAAAAKAPAGKAPAKAAAAKAPAAKVAPAEKAVGKTAPAPKATGKAAPAKPSPDKAPAAKAAVAATTTTAKAAPAAEHEEPAAKAAKTPAKTAGHDKAVTHDKAAKAETPAKGTATSEAAPPPAASTTTVAAAPARPKAEAAKPVPLAKAQPAPVLPEDDEPRELFYQRQRALLVAERNNYTRQAEELRAQAAALALEHEPGDVQFDEEGGEGGTANVDRELDLHLSAQAQAAIEEIDAALAKIEEGTYGTCESCGNPVPKARLEAIPHARLCVTCKSGGLSARRQ